jgi:hypothetical protein
MTDYRKSKPRAGSSRAQLRCLGLGLVWVLALTASWCLAAPASAAVYWTNLSGNAIGQANLEGTGVNAKFITFPPPYIRIYPLGIAVDGQHVYWSDSGTSASPGTLIGRANLDGGGVNVAFITGAHEPGGIAVDGQHIYWVNIYTSNSAQDTIGRANLDGSGVNQSFIASPGGATGVAVDGSHIYWSDGADAIGRANLDGTGVNPRFITGARAPVSIAVDGQHIYWGNDSTNTIARANLDGTGVNESLIGAAGAPEGVAVAGPTIYWSNDDGTVGRANLDGTGATNTFITGAGQSFGVAVDGSGGSGCRLPPPGGSPIDCGPGTAGTGGVQGVTWGQSCASDVGCFPVSFTYTLRGSMDFEVYGVGQAPWIFTRITRLRSSLVIDQGWSNGWGIQIVPGVAPYLAENWQVLPCINQGVKSSISPGVIPTAPLGSVDPSASIIVRDGPVGYSLYDPELIVTALGYAKDYEYETGSNLFSFDTPSVGLVSPGCSSFAGAARARVSRTHLGIATPASVAAVARAPDGAPAALRKVRVPRVTADGRALAPAALSRTAVTLAGQNKKLTPETAVREAVATAVLDVLLSRQAIAGRPVAPRILAANLDALAKAYQRSPRAAERAGVRVPSGESPRRYFSSPQRLRAYRSLLALGALRDSIVRGAKGTAARRQRYARWLGQALRHHRVKVVGVPRFSLPAALPAGVS